MSRAQRADDDVGRLVGGRMSRAAAGEVCPDAEVLAAYVDNGLTEAEIARVDAHLASCASCRALMARLAPIEAAGAAPAAGWRMPAIDARWGALAASLLVAAVVWMAWPRATPLPATTMARHDAVAGATDQAAARSAAPQTAPPRAALRGPTAEPASPPAAKPSLSTAPPPSGQAQQPAALVEEARQATRDTDTLQRRLRQAPPPASRDERAASTRPAEALAGPAPAPPVLAQAPPAPTQAAPVGGAGVAGGRAIGPPSPPPAVADAQAAQNAVGADKRAEKLADALRERAGAATFAMRVGSAAATGGASFAEPEGRLRWRIVGGRRIDSSSDGGTSWNPSFDAGAGVRLFAGSAPSLSAAWVCGANGVVLRRAYPGGWARVPDPSTEDLMEIAATSDASARVTTRSGQVFETTDGGATWAAR
jgi:hypothetical protein